MNVMNPQMDGIANGKHIELCILERSRRENYPVINYVTISTQTCILLILIRSTGNF